MKPKLAKRAVSPMIATILLVAITVVLAAVLYVLVANLGSGATGPRPVSLEMTLQGSDTLLPGGASWANFSLDPSQTLTTAYFGLALVTSGGAFVPGGTGGCPHGAVSCSVTGGWLAFLSNSQGTIVNVWTGNGWDNSTVTVTPALTLAFLAYPPLHVAGSGDYLKVTSHAEPTVVGQSTYL